MNPVQPEELSALIDGELDARRAAEVEAQIASDEGLRATFESLRDLDSRWRAAARTVVLAPQVHLPAPARWSGGWIPAIAIAAALVSVRIATRLIDTTTMAFALQAFVLAIVLARVAWAGRSDVRSGINP
jgi:anti-sigma factor RsiW